MSVSENFEEPDSVEVPFFNIHPPKEEPWAPYELKRGTVSLENVDKQNELILSEHQARLKAMKERYKLMGDQIDKADTSTIPGVIQEKTKTFTDYIKDSKWRMLFAFSGVGFVMWVVFKILSIQWVKNKKNIDTFNYHDSVRRLDFFKIPDNDTPRWRK